MFHLSEVHIAPRLRHNAEILQFSFSCLKDVVFLTIMRVPTITKRIVDILNFQNSNFRMS